MKEVVFIGDTLNTDEPLGIQRYAYEILKELDKLDLPYNCKVLIPKEQNVNIKFSRIQVQRYGTYRYSKFFWRQFYFPKFVNEERAIGVDLTLALPYLGVDVVCLHDCIYENFPQDFIGIKRNVRRWSYLFRAKKVVKESKIFITPSETSKKELMEHYKIPKDKIFVIYNGWQHFDAIEEDIDILKKLDLEPKSYYFALGSKLPHKNYRWIDAAAKQNKKDLFVIAGSTSLAKDYSSNMQKNILYAGFLKDGEIKTLMKYCKAFIHPSLYEGFGIPPLEAISCGANVYLSNASCLPEIYGNNIDYFSPYDMENIKLTGIKKLDDKNRKEILNKYSWKTSAAKLNHILSAIAAED